MLIEVYSKDFSRDAAAIYSPSSFAMPSIPCQVSVTTSHDVNDRDYNILRDRLSRTIEDQGLADILAKNVAELASTADEEIAMTALRDPGEIKARVDAFKKDAQAAVDEFAARVKKAFGDAWIAFMKDHDAYQTYKIKVGVDISVAAVSLAGSVASLALIATPAAPAALVLSIYGALKNTSKMIVTIRAAMREAESVADELTGDCKSLETKLTKLAKLQKEAEKKDAEAKKKAEAAAKAAKSKEKVKELAVSFANKISGDLVGVKVSTIEGVASKASLYANKCRGIQEKTKGIADEYLQTIDQMLQLGAYCDAMEDYFHKFTSALSYSSQAKAEILSLIRKISSARKAWDGMQETMKSLNEDVAACEKRYQENVARSQKFSETAKKAQKAFETENWAEAGRWLGVAADVGLTAGGGGAGSWETSEKAITTSLKLVQIFEKEAITELKKKM